VGFFLNLDRVPQLITKLVHTAVLVPRYGAIPLAALSLCTNRCQHVAFMQVLHERYRSRPKAMKNLAL
jgi:hypothetical protein